MIAEYALEPEMVATWGDHLNHRFFIREFGLGSGRLVSRYPKKWAKKVWESYPGGSEMARKRLEELLVRMQDTMVKRKDLLWDDSKTWVDNAVQEHARHPFQAILARNNPLCKPEILGEDTLGISPCPGWDSPNGCTVNRTAHDMAAAVKRMLTCCRWVKFVDPYICQCGDRHREALQAFLQILLHDRPVGPPEVIEIHTKGDGASTEYLKDFCGKIIANGQPVTLYQWQQRSGGQKLHNRYILTDLGGVSFHHGLDAGTSGETDDISRLNFDQYIYRCKQYDPVAPAFDQASDPLVIVGLLAG